MTAAALAVLLVLAAPADRPYTGAGILFLAPPRDGLISLYRYPGGTPTGGAKAVSSLPTLARFMNLSSAVPVAAHAWRGEWARLAVDDRGKEAWIPLGRESRIVPWDRFLEGREARVLQGTKEGKALQEEPRSDARATLPISADSVMRIVSVRRDWALVACGESRGWLRWRDGNGKLLLRVK